MKDKLVGCLYLVSAIAENFTDYGRGRVAGKRAHAGVALIISTDRVVKFSRSVEQDAEVRSQNGIGRCVENEVGFERACIHAEHHVVVVR